MHKYYDVIIGYNIRIVGIFVTVLDIMYLLTLV